MTREATTAVARAAVFHGPGRPLEMQAFQLPTPLAGEAIVRIECCTVCGSDLHTIGGARTEKTPSILGHEILGVVEAVGSPPPTDVSGRLLECGDRIVWSVAVSCGTCDRCLAGMSQKCRSLSKYGHETATGRDALSGGLADYLLLRSGSAAVRISSDMPAEVVCPASCATATVAAAVRVGGTIAGRRVLIFGAGMLGLTMAAFARSNGAARVFLADVDPRRLELAARFGADETVLLNGEANTPSQSFDLIFEMSGSPDAVEAAVESADVGGRIVLVGSVMKSRPVNIDPERVVRNWLAILGVHNYAPIDLQTAVSFLEEHGSDFPFAELVEKSYSLSDVNAALDNAVRTRPIRIAIRP